MRPKADTTPIRPYPKLCTHTEKVELKACAKIGITYQPVGVSPGFNGGNDGEHSTNDGFPIEF
jgi:hypothetical protein